MLREALKEKGIEVLVEAYDGFKSVDLVIPNAKLNIEVDGIHHLTNPYQIAADLSRDHYSDEMGFGTLHVHNWEVRTNLDKIASAIAEAAIIRESRFMRRYQGG